MAAESKLVAGFSSMVSFSGTLVVGNVIIKANDLVKILA